MVNPRIGELIGCGMIRLTMLLCGGLFLVLLIAGQDKGQVRQGLMTPPEVPQVRAPVVVASEVPMAEPVPDVTEVVFVPTQPVRVVPVVESAPEVTLPEPAQPEPQAQFAVVNARSVNVRSGPSTSDAVIGRLVNGEQVLVVVEENPVDGWSLIRIEGDGIEGYVATRLLQPLTP